MKFNRASGILLHPTSLPSNYGIGDMGPEAYEFIDFLKGSQQSLWQVLPLNPPGYGESPFQCFSAFAGNPLLISPEGLVAEGLLSRDDLAKSPAFDQTKVEFERVREYKGGLLKKAFSSFKGRKSGRDYQKFIASNPWLEDYALFMALRDYFGGLPWNRWEKPIVLREVRARQYYKNLLAEAIEYHFFVQYVFFTQWLALKGYANEQGVKIIGDLPIFVSYDSSDAWSSPHLFELDEKGSPLKVAGVPPDYFSETGQLWGNPLYKWGEMEKDNFQWWLDRFSSLLKMVDIIRIDHFRGFEAYWEIEAGEETAINGRWVKAPGAKLFTTVQKHLGKIPVIAEDLGLITPEVKELKDQFQFPGMKVLHFHLNSGEKEEMLPHNYEENSVVYTGTHDNDTTLGWYKKLLLENPGEIAFLDEYLGLDGGISGKDICWRMIHVAFQSKANMVIIPMQDVLCLDTDARMNYPGTVGGNWDWRYTPGSLTSELQEKLAHLATRHNRNPRHK